MKSIEVDYAINDAVRIERNDSPGEVMQIWATETEMHYYVKYVDGSGRVVSQWFLPRELILVVDSLSEVSP